MQLSDSELLALEALARADFLAPSEIGYAMTPSRSHPLKGQGAGRVGARMAKRLIDKGLVQDCAFKRGGFPAYRLTSIGRKVITNG